MFGTELHRVRVRVRVRVHASLRMCEVVCSLPIPVAARSKAYVCDRSLAGIMDSIPAGRMVVCFL
jgi:hypothetical protein